MCVWVVLRVVCVSGFRDSGPGCECVCVCAGWCVWEMVLLRFPFVQFYTRTYGGVRTIDLYFEWIKNGFMFSNLEKWKYTTCMWKWMVVVCARSVLCFVHSLNLYSHTHTHLHTLAQHTRTNCSSCLANPSYLRQMHGIIQPYSNFKSYHHRSKSEIVCRQLAVAFIWRDSNLKRYAMRHFPMLFPPTICFPFFFVSPSIVIWLFSEMFIAYVC